MGRIDLGLLSAFNPHELPEATVYAVATGRDEDLSGILGDVHGNLGAGTLQHLIISGPRGYGKSFLMRHLELELQHKIKDDSWNVAVVMMPEEMPHVREPETLIREITRTFEGGDSSTTELSWHEDDGAAWENAVEALEAAINQRLGKRGLLVALIENFDVILRNAFPKSVHTSRLREFLTRADGQVMLITASATGAFDRDYDRPLFQAFKEVILAPWSVDQCLNFFDRQRHEAGLGPLEGAMLGRAKAVAAFIGGTPRLATLLGEALLNEDVLKAADLLQRIVDELTPYYKERVEALPGRSQKLLDALLRYGEPATQSELARRVNAKGQAAIAGPFNTLIQERIVTGARAPGSAEVLYRVADRVFAHFYRRRTIVHGSPSCALEALVDLLAVYFTPDEKRAKITEFVRKGLIEEARILAHLHAAETGQGRDNQKRTLHLLKDHYIPKRLAPIASASVADALRKCAELAVAGRIDDSRKVLKEINFSIATPSDLVVCLLTRSRLDAAEGLDGGLAAAEEAMGKSDPNTISHRLALTGKVWSLGELGRYEEAIITGHGAAALAKAAGDQGEQATALRLVAWSLGELGRYEEAIHTANEAAALAKAADDQGEHATTMRLVAWSLGRLGRYDEAINAGRLAAALAKATDDLRGEGLALRYIALSLSQLERYEEATSTANLAAALAKAAGYQGEEAMALNIVARCLGQLGRHEEATSAAHKGAEVAKLAGDQKGHALALRYVAWSLGQLGRHEEAILTGHKVAALAKTAGDQRGQALSMRYTAWSLGALGRYEEAISTGREAAALANAVGEKGEQAMALCSVGWNLGQLERFQEAIRTGHEAAALSIEAGDATVKAYAFNLVVLFGLKATPEPTWYTKELGEVARIIDVKQDPNLVAEVKLTAKEIGLSLAESARVLDTWHRVFASLHADLSNSTFGDLLVIQIVSAMADDMTRKVTAPDRLDLASEVIDLHFPGRFGDTTARLRATARYHHSGRDPAVLARMEPDLASALRIVHPPISSPVSKAKRKKR